MKIEDLMDKERRAQYRLLVTLYHAKETLRLKRPNEAIKLV